MTTFAFALFLLLLISAYASETFTVPNLQTNVRTISLKEGDSVTGSITVSGGSGNDVNFYATDPNSNTILRLDRTTQTSFSFSATTTGTYTMIFDNTFSLISSKTVTLDYSVKSQVLGIPQDTMLAVIGLIVAILVAILLAAFLRRKRRTE
jgi:hypothetical protein